MLESAQLLWWQWWLLIAISINTTINLIVFFKGRKLHIREFLHLKPKSKRKGDTNGEPSTK
jgi:uncharacterized protein YpmS